MPRPDPTERKDRRAVRGRSFTPGFARTAWIDALGRGKRKPKQDKDSGGVPVEPDRPRNLSGGAAAALEYDD